jgi:ubiquinone/menaquinone biosynthesis C-methylase UbiE
LEKDERQVAEWYNTLSGSYDELYGREQSSKHNTILEFLGNRHFRVLLDIGCGTGLFLEKANEICDQSIGIDLSANMLRIAKDRRIPNTDFVLATSSSLPFRDESSDCTVSISTAKAEPNLPRFIADVERVARGDYLLAITLFHQSGTIDAVTLPHVVLSTKISERETLYFLRPAHRPGTADDPAPSLRGL